MNQQTHLHKTQLHLTIIFTLLVFLIASFLEISFFSYKYISWIIKEKNKLEYLSNVINDKNIPLYKINSLIKNEKKLWEERIEQRDINMIPRWKIINFAILDSYNNVLLENIRWDIDLNAVKSVLENKDTDVQLENNTIIKYLPIERTIENYQLLIFKQLNYDLEAYLSDMVRFLIAIWLFSILFFIIGYFFVKKNLKPVEDNIIEMNDFIHNAWHELKTPISVINSNLQLMKQFWVYKESMINENITEINRLNDLIEALVTISDIQDNTNLISNSIASEINYIIDENKTIISKKQIDIKHIQISDFNILADKEYLYIVLSNIIKNAIKFSHEWSAINISFMDNQCIIQDYWVWIDEKNLDNIFNRFFQEQQSRNSDWFGIWLALVSKIANIYNWKITVESIKNQGTKFIINFK